jgi:hypothetical protein
MGIIIEKEIPSEGGWQISEFETVRTFISIKDALHLLSGPSYRLVKDDKFDRFWQDSVKYPWARYRVKGFV